MKMNWEPTLMGHAIVYPVTTVTWLMAWVSVIFVGLFLGPIRLLVILAFTAIMSTIPLQIWATKNVEKRAGVVHMAVAVQAGESIEKV
jgi:hypothetical protein